MLKIIKLVVGKLVIHHCNIISRVVLWKNLLADIVLLRRIRYRWVGLWGRRNLWLSRCSGRKIGIVGMSNIAARYRRYTLRWRQLWNRPSIISQNRWRINLCSTTIIYRSCPRCLNAFASCWLFSQRRQSCSMSRYLVRLCWLR